jgi:hypothetical protein
VAITDEKLPLETMPPQLVSAFSNYTELTFETLRETSGNLQRSCYALPKPPYRLPRVDLLGPEVPSLVAMSGCTFGNTFALSSFVVVSESSNVLRGPFPAKMEENDNDSEARD